MGISEKNSMTPAPKSPTQSDDLPSLVERLTDEIAKLFDQKMALLKIEVKEEVKTYISGALLILAGGIFAMVGFALANIALAFLVSTLFADMDISQPSKYAFGFFVTSLAYLLIGALLIVITKNRLAKQGIVPRRTMEELERDKEWLQKEL